MAKRAVPCCLKDIFSQGHWEGLRLRILLSSSICFFCSGISFCGSITCLSLSPFARQWRVVLTTRLNGGGLDPTSDLKCMLCDYDDFAITNYSMFRYQTIINFVCNFQLKIEFYCFSNYFNVFNRR